MRGEARMFDPYQTRKRLPMIPVSISTAVQAFTSRDQTCSSRPRSCSWHSDQGGLMRLVTTHDFVRDANSMSWIAIRALQELIDGRKPK